MFAETYKDFAAIYDKLQTGTRHKPGDILPEDRMHTRGTRAYSGKDHAQA